MLSLLAFILAVFPIVIIHEFGHFLIGKYLGAEPTDFSVGFGKVLFQFRFLDANFKISAIPLGGYVKFNKIQFDAESTEANKESLKINPIKWFWISIAGPMSNFVFTFIVFFGIMLTAGLSINISEVTKSSLSHIPVGSKIMEVKEGSLNSFVKKNMLEESKSNVFVKNSKGDAVAIENFNEIKKSLVLEKRNENLLGVFLKSTLNSLDMLKLAFMATTKSIVNIFTASDTKDLIGPIGISGEAKKAMNVGILQFLLLMASISFALGYFNLLPLSFLDGGRAILAVMEFVTKTKISGKTLGQLHLFGLLVVGVLMVLGFYNDITKLIDK